MVVRSEETVALYSGGGREGVVGAGGGGGWIEQVGWGGTQRSPIRMRFLSSLQMMSGWTPVESQRRGIESTTAVVLGEGNPCGGEGVPWNVNRIRTHGSEGDGALIYSRRLDNEPAPRGVGSSAAILAARAFKPFAWPSSLPRCEVACGIGEGQRRPCDRHP
jgi:hypothetical protein